MDEEIRKQQATAAPSARCPNHISAPRAKCPNHKAPAHPHDGERVGCRARRRVAILSRLQLGHRCGRQCEYHLRQQLAHKHVALHYQRLGLLATAERTSCTRKRSCSSRS